jgi:TolA-binding protein
LSKEIVDSPIESIRDISPDKTGKTINNINIDTHKTGKDMAEWRSLIISGQVEQAFTQISKYLSTSQKDAEAMMMLATCQKKMGKFNEAVKTYRKVSSLSNGGEANQARYFAGDICQSRLGDHSCAKEMFEKYLANTSIGSANRAEAELRLAKSLLNLNESSRAKKILREIIASHGRATVANRARAILEANP